MSKTWLITGASSGLGRLTTERLLARGDRVVATVRREDSLADLQKEHGVRLVSPIFDLTDTAGIRAVLASTFRQLGRIDVLVSNAGYGLFGAVEEVTDAQIDHQISTNLIGSIQFIRAAIPHLRQQGRIPTRPRTGKPDTATTCPFCRRLFVSCFWRRARNWRASISTGRISMSQRWRTCSATRIRILFIELSERGKGRHPPS